MTWIEALEAYRSERMQAEKRKEARDDEQWLKLLKLARREKSRFIADRNKRTNLRQQILA